MNDNPKESVHFLVPWRGKRKDRCAVTANARLWHPHGPGHYGAPHHRRDRTSDIRRLTIALSITTLVLVVEFIGGIFSDSLALLSDAGHMLTDISAQVLSLLAVWFSSRPADARRTYGYYRLEILAALANGALLLLVAGGIFFEATQRLSEPPQVQTGLLLLVATVGLCANLLGAWLLHGAQNLNVRGAYLHILSDAASSVVVIMGGVIMAWSQGLFILDPILSMFIAVLVVLGGMRLIREAVGILLEAVPTGIDLEKVREDMKQIDGVADVHDLHIWTITSGFYALSAHVVVKDSTKPYANDALLNQIKELILKQHHIAHSTLQMESMDYEHISNIERVSHVH